MLRNFLAVIAGIFIGNVVIRLIQRVSNEIYPIPESLDTSNMEALAEYINTLPFNALLLLLLSHVIGTLIAAFVAVRISSSHSPLFALVVGGLILLMAVVFFFQLKHPVWFMALDLILYLPIAWLGGQLALKTLRPKTTES